MPNEIEIQQHVIDLLKDEKEGLLKDKDELLKKLSEANSDLRKLRLCNALAVPDFSGIAFFCYI